MKFVSKIKLKYLHFYQRYKKQNGKTPTALPTIGYNLPCCSISISYVKCLASVKMLKMSYFEITKKKIIVVFIRFGFVSF